VTVRKAVYPGSFDPVTFGHLDLIERGSKIFDELVVSVSADTAKEHLFSAAERIEMTRELVKPYKNVTVDSFDGLAIEHLARHKTNIILRGIRTVSDFEYEFQMALTNRTMASEVETVLVMSDERFSFIHSGLIKEIARLGGPLKGMVPPLVEEALRRKLKV
jgi:pantetheine-phosphate adenylyltransferase